MASIIIFSTLWGIVAQGVEGHDGRAPSGWWPSGLALLVASTVIVGYGNYLAAQAYVDPEVVTTWRRADEARAVAEGLDHRALAASSPRACGAGAGSPLIPVDLRCDWMVDPLGVDSAPPRLSWQLQGDGSARAPAEARGRSWWPRSVESLDGGSRGRLGQRARRVRRAAPRALRRPPPCARPSGLLEGARLGRRRIARRPGARPRAWTMGVLEPADWKAHWITDPALLRWVRPRLGLSFRGVGRPEHRRSGSQVDLGSVARPIDEVRFYAVRHTVPEGLGFPPRFKVEVASRAGLRRRRARSPTNRDRTTTPWASADRACRPHGRRRALRAADRDPPPRVRRQGLPGLEPDRGALRRTERRAAGAKVTASDSVEQAAVGRGGGDRRPGRARARIRARTARCCCAASSRCARVCARALVERLRPRATTR